MNNISIEDYYFLQIIGHPYTGKVDDRIQAISIENYWETYNYKTRTLNGYFYNTSSNSIADDEDGANLSTRYFLSKLQEKYPELWKGLQPLVDLYQEYLESNIQESKRYYQEIEQALVNWIELVKVSANMTKNWFLGEGAATRYFKNNNVALAMKDSKGVHKNRLAFYEKARNSGYIQGLTWTNARVGFGLEGLIFAGLDPIEQFVGSCNIEIKCVDGKVLHFKLLNKTSFESFLYHMSGNINKALNLIGIPELPEWEWERETFKYMSNMIQYYEWDELVDTNLLQK